MPRSFAFELLDPRLHLRTDPNPGDNVYFRLPLSSDTSVHFYYDRNESAAGALAWNGSTSQTYNDHNGTDFSGGPRGRAVFASAPGILIGKDDGWGDGQGPGNGNYVRINHGNNRLGLPINSVYLHFEAGTPTTKPLGSFIAAGEQIGGVGTSGNSTGLHLHLETQINRVAFDPYKAVGSNEISWWTNQGTGAPSTAAQPNKMTVGDTTQVYELAGTDSLSVRSTPAGATIGTRSNGASGTVLEGPTWAAFNGDINNSLWVWYKVRWSDGLEGWSVQNWLRKPADVVAPSVNSSAFLFESNPLRATLSFSEAVGTSLTASDFQIQNLTTGGNIIPSLTYSTTTNVATLLFGSNTADGNYRVRAIAAGILDTGGNPMAADYFGEFFIFAGDANRDRTINIADFSILASRFNQPGTFSNGDFNYNGVTDIGDFSILAAKFNTSLPAPSAPRAAAAPTAHIESFRRLTPITADFEDMLNGTIITED